DFAGGLDVPAGRQIDGAPDGALESVAVEDDLFQGPTVRASEEGQQAGEVERGHPDGEEQERAAEGRPQHGDQPDREKDPDQDDEGRADGDPTAGDGDRGLDSLDVGCDSVDLSHYQAPSRLPFDSST